VNGLRICKLRNGVKKNASISSIFNGKRRTKCAGISPQLSKLTA
jgi:hypothetical protein